MYKSDELQIIYNSKFFFIDANLRINFIRTIISTIIRQLLTFSKYFLFVHYQRIKKDLANLEDDQVRTKTGTESRSIYSIILVFLSILIINLVANAL